MYSPATEREIFSIVGPRYQAFDVDQIAAQLIANESIPADAKCSVTYDGYKAKWDILFASNVQPERVCAGEIFKAGIYIKTADDGSGSIKVGAQVWRNLCLNLIIIDHAKAGTTRRKHYGKNIADDVAKGVDLAMSKIQHFADAWSAATVEDVLDKYGVSDIEAVMRGLVFNKVVHVANVKPQDMFERLMRAYQMEPGYGKNAIVNAVTRAAHMESWSGGYEDVVSLEETGGALLFQPVWNVAIPEGTSLSY